MSISFASHPIHHWIPLTNQASTAILSQHLPLSFLFHISINLISSQPCDSHSRVVVVGRSKSTFDQLIETEADAHLANLSSQPSLLHVLERLEFCFCDGLNQLVQLFQALAHLHAQPNPAPDPRSIIPPTRPPAPISALIILDPSSYLSADQQSLGRLTKLLTFIFAAHHSLASTSSPPVLFLLDHVHPAQSWPLQTTHGPVSCIFKHFCRSVWTVKQVEAPKTGRFELEQVDGGGPTIIYEVLDGDEDGPGEGRRGLKWTLLVKR